MDDRLARRAAAARKGWRTRKRMAAARDQDARETSLPFNEWDNLVVGGARFDEDGRSRAGRTIVWCAEQRLDAKRPS